MGIAGLLGANKRIKRDYDRETSSRDSAGVLRNPSPAMTPLWHIYKESTRYKPPPHTHLVVLLENREESLLRACRLFSPASSEADASDCKQQDYSDYAPLPSQKIGLF